jgi:signal transduction histidine kinase
MPSLDPAVRKGLYLTLGPRYRKALFQHLKSPSAATKQRATELGQFAQSKSLVTLDLAIIHEQAVASLDPEFHFASPRNPTLRQASEFFTIALIPLEHAQSVAREAHDNLIQRKQILDRHAKSLAVANRRLEREVARRKAATLLAQGSKQRYRVLLVESQVMQKKLRSLTRQIITAQEEERREISRDLHDDVVQTLVGINVELSALGEGASVGLKLLKAKIARTQRLVTNSVNAVHRFARELRPAALDDLGLIPALNAYTKSLSKRKKLKIHLNAFAGVEALGCAKRTVLFRVAQEALTNVARHAQATSVSMKIHEINGSIHMEVADNGKSFAVEKTLLTHSRNRLGLVGMRERVEMVGGRLSIISTKGKGTTVRAEIPFDKDTKNHESTV